MKEHGLKVHVYCCCVFQAVVCENGPFFMLRDIARC